MKLWVRSKKDGQLRDVDVCYWSFVKCYFLAGLGLTLIIWGSLFVIGIAMAFLGLLVV